MTQSHQNINKIFIFFAYCPSFWTKTDSNNVIDGYPITPVIGYKNKSHFHLLLQKTTNHYKIRRQSKGDNQEEVEKLGIK